MTADNNCSLLASHDDFSILHDLPPNTAVFTQIRNPVDRTLSAYEMALEVGCSSLAFAAWYLAPNSQSLLLLHRGLPPSLTLLSPLLRQIGSKYANETFVKSMEAKRSKAKQDKKLSQFVMDIWPWSVLAPIFGEVS